MIMTMMIMVAMIVIMMIVLVAATTMRVVGMMLAELDVSICAAAASQGVIGEEIGVAGRISCGQ
jgi:hypothetical protein